MSRLDAYLEIWWFCANDDMIDYFTLAHARGNKSTKSYNSYCKMR